MSDAYTDAVIRDLQRERDSQSSLVHRLQLENDKLKRQLATAETRLANCQRYNNEND